MIHHPFIRDFGQRTHDLMSGSKCAEKYEVTGAVLRLFATLVVAYERLELMPNAAGVQFHPAADQAKWHREADLLKQKMPTAFETWMGSSDDWGYALLGTSHARWRTVVTIGVCNGPITLQDACRVLRNAIAHANIFTEVDRPSDSDQIASVCFLNSKQCGSRRNNTPPSDWEVLKFTTEGLLKFVDKWEATVLNLRWSCAPQVVLPMEDQQDSP